MRTITGRYIFSASLIAIVLASGCAGAKTEIKTPQFLDEQCTTPYGGGSMSYSEAKDIAEDSPCGKYGLKSYHYCSQTSGKWSIDLDIEKEGCKPACIINIETKSAQIDWRCA